MSVTKKNTTRRPSKRKAENKPVIVTKSVSAARSSFPKKIKSMNTLLAKAKLLSS